MSEYDKSKLSEHEQACCFFDDDNRTVEEVRVEFQTDLPARCRDCPMLEVHSPVSAAQVAEELLR